MLVCGLGAMGCAALAHLARRDADVVGLEQHEVGHPHGSSHGRSRAFRLAYETPVYAELGREAGHLWEELEARRAERLLVRCGVLIWAPRGNEQLDRRRATLAGTGVPHESLDPGEVWNRFGLRLPPDTAVLHETEGGFLHADRAVAAHLSEARDAGARVLEGTAVRRVDLGADEPVVETSDGAFRCRRLVLAPGPWASRVLGEGFGVRVTRQPKLAFRVRDPGAVAPERLPVYADLPGDRYGFPHLGPGLEVADDRPGPEVTPETAEREISPEEGDRLGRWLGEILPGAEPEFVEGTTCLYSLTPDRHFSLGPHPDHPAAVVAAGFSGHGFKFVPLVGRICADLALDGETRFPIEQLRPGRFT